MHVSQERNLPAVVSLSNEDALNSSVDEVFMYPGLLQKTTKVAKKNNSLFSYGTCRLNKGSYIKFLVQCRNSKLNQSRIPTRS